MLPATPPQYYRSKKQKKMCFCWVIVCVRPPDFNIVLHHSDFNLWCGGGFFFSRSTASWVNWWFVFMYFHTIWTHYYYFLCKNCDNKHFGLFFFSRDGAYICYIVLPGEGWPTMLKYLFYRRGLSQFFIFHCLDEQSIFRSVYNKLAQYTNGKMISIENNYRNWFLLWSALYSRNEVSSSKIN